MNPTPDFADVVMKAVAVALIQEKQRRHIAGEKPMFMADLLAVGTPIIRALHAESLCADATGKKPRPRNLLLDTLVTLNGEKLEEVAPPMFRQAVAALRDIRSVCPNVTPLEIKRRYANLRVQMPNATHSCTSLAKWWATVDRATVGSGGDSAQVRT